ncbi:MAG: hypothetical protein LBH92_05485 [Bacteroidales bacterium]|jgi:hypothetical protein|nr:hypothetical protein [Bacteroidales bacterium]
MKKEIFLFSVIFLFFVAFIILSYVYYKIQPDTVYLPISITFLLFCNIIKLLYNQNEKKKERFLPIGKSIMYKGEMFILIFLLILFFIWGMNPNIGKVWMHIKYGWFYGIGFFLAILLSYKPYLFALRRKKVIFNKIMPFAKNLLYTNIKEVTIESNEVVFIDHDRNQTSCDVKLTEEEKNKIIRILTKNNVTVIY